jgi:hypothetical protein
MKTECSFNKELLLLTHVGEAGPADAERVGRHTATCAACRAYLADLAEIGLRLEEWPEERPLPQTLGRIERVIQVGWNPAVPERHAPEPALPFLLISGLVAVLLLAAGWLQRWVTMLPVWGTRLGGWLIQLLGPFGVTLALVLLLGAFISLALLPALFWEIQNRRDTWRMT